MSVIRLPSAQAMPADILAEAAELGADMANVVVLWQDQAGRVHVRWSRQRNSDLATAAVVLQATAARELIGGGE